MAGLSSASPDGRSPAQQLLAIRERVEELVARQDREFLEGVAPGLGAAGIRFSSWHEIDADDEKFLVATFEDRTFPALTPLAVDPGHPTTADRWDGELGCVAVRYRWAVELNINTTK